VQELNIEAGAVLGLDTEGHGLADGELSAQKVDLVVGADLVVVGRVSEGERKHTLLLQVGLVDTSERAGNDGETTKVAGLQSGVFTGRSLSVVPVTDDDPLDTLGLVVTSGVGDGTVLAGEGVANLVRLSVLVVDGTDQHVVGDVVKVSTVLEPGTGHGDVVGGGLATALDENGEVRGVLSVPGGERSEDLKTVRGGGNPDLDGRSILGRSLVRVTARVVALLGETSTGGRGKEKVVSVLVLDGVGQGVEVKGTGNRESGDQVRGGDESVSRGVGVVTSGEVTVVRRQDGVGLTLLDVLTVPLTDARTASVGKNDTTELLEGGELAVTRNSGTDLLGTRGDSVDGLRLDTVVKGVTGDRSGARHVLVGGVGARSDQTDLELSRPALLLDGLLPLGKGSGQVRGEGSVDVRLELAQVDLDHLVVLGTLVGLELLGVSASKVTNVRTLGGRKVLVHGLVEGEDGGGGSNLSTHVADGSHSSGGQSVDTRSGVFDDRTSSTLDSEDTSQLQDDVCHSISSRFQTSRGYIKLTLRSGPALELTSKLDTNDIRGLELPRKSSHDIDGVSTTDTDGSHTETTSVRSVGIRSNQETSRESVVLQDDLVNDTRARTPETKSVLGARRRQEVVHLLVDGLGSRQVLLTTDLGLNQVVAVHGRGGSDFRKSGAHELEDGHLGGGILASDTVRSQLQVGNSTLDVLSVGVVQVRVQNLLSVRQRPVKTRAHDLEVLAHFPTRDVSAQATMTCDVSQS
jgi:hypothetical protein